jgi:LacI family transcriptional regulator
MPKLVRPSPALFHSPAKAETMADTPASKSELPGGPSICRRVTQRDVADAAGVHNTTVSLALRNNPCIPAETRQRIQAIAERLGYRPDPALRALATYRRNVAISRRTETVAYVTTSPTRFGWKEDPAENQLYVGAARKAAEYGYQLEVFWLNDAEMNAARLSRMLFHRGVAGVVISAANGPRVKPLNFDWSTMTGVIIGCAARIAELPRVANDVTGGVRQAVRRALAAGYTRPGLLLPYGLDDQFEQAFSVGFLTEQSRLPAASHIPVLYHSHHHLGGDRHEAPQHPLFFSRWLKTYRPDVLIGPHALARALADKVGLSIPEHIALVDPCCERTDPEVAGVRQSRERVGELGFEILASQLQQNVRALPEFPTVTLVEGAWQDGASLPMRGDHAAPFAETVGQSAAVAGLM